MIKNTITISAIVMTMDKLSARGDAGATSQRCRRAMRIPLNGMYRTTPIQPATLWTTNSEGKTRATQRQTERVLGEELIVTVDSLSHSHSVEHPQNERHASRFSAMVCSLSGTGANTFPLWRVHEKPRARDRRVAISDHSACDPISGSDRLKVACDRFTHPDP